MMAYCITNSSPFISLISSNLLILHLSQTSSNKDFATKYLLSLIRLFLLS